MLLSALLVCVGFSLPGALGGIPLVVTGWPYCRSNLVAILAGSVLLRFTAIGLTLRYYDVRREEGRDHFADLEVE